MTPAPGARRSIPWVKIACGIIVVVGLVLGGRRLAGLIPGLTAEIRSLGPWAPVIFVIAYTVAVVAFVPGSLLTLAAGALFGLAGGTLVAFLGAMIGSALAFLVARYGARARIERMLAGNERFAAIDRAIGTEGRKIVFLLRLSPVFPFNLLNYALGLTRVRFADYLLAGIGMLPGTILYVYYGRVAGDAAALAGGYTPPRGAAYYLVLGAGLAATLVVTFLITKMARRALAEAVQ